MMVLGGATATKSSTVCLANTRRNRNYLANGVHQYSLHNLIKRQRALPRWFVSDFWFAPKLRAITIASDTALRLLTSCRDSSPVFARYQSRGSLVSTQGFGHVHVCRSCRRKHGRDNCGDQKHDDRSNHRLRAR